MELLNVALSSPRLQKRKLTIDTAEVFLPLLEPARYKGAYGGRGSGKSHFFASLMIDDCVAEPSISGEGLRCICIRELQKDLKESSKLILEDKIRAFGLGEADGFRIWKDRIETPKGGLIIFKGMQDYSSESIKSLEGFKRAWIEEAQTLSENSLMLLRPTLFRVKDAQIWASWNPRKKNDAIDLFLRKNPPDDALVVQANWRDNPWFFESGGMEKERLHDLEYYPERYHHIWEGEYAKAFAGAYFAKHLTTAKLEKRISRVARDPILPLKAFFDLGGTSARADAMAIWIVQFVGREIRVLDYMEGIGQELGYYIAELRKRKYEQALLVLPHDGDAHHGPIRATYRSLFEEAGFEVDVIPNQGPGAAAMRIEAARRIFPRCWFNEETTESGREALGFYHEKKDVDRGIGMGPEHDWSSHCADAFGLMAVVYEEEPVKRRGGRSSSSPPSGATHWSA